MAAPDFVHLRVHSDFSMVDGLAKTKPIVAKVLLVKANYAFYNARIIF